MEPTFQPKLSADFPRGIPRTTEDFPLSARPYKDAETERIFPAEGKKGGSFFVVVLQPIPGNDRLPPPIVRLKHLLKRALRDWRLKCVSVREEGE